MTEDEAATIQNACRRGPNRCGMDHIAGRCVAAHCPRVGLAELSASQLLDDWLCGTLNQLDHKGVAIKGVRREDLLQLIAAARDVPASASESVTTAPAPLTDAVDRVKARFRTDLAFAKSLLPDWTSEQVQSVFAAPQAAPGKSQAPCGGREYCGRFPFCGCGGPDPLPERDMTKPAEQQGVFHKFDVRRTDGSSELGGKHHGCEHFVLDVDHDPCARLALAAYADAVEATHPVLAADMRDRYGLAASAPQAAPVSARIDPMQDPLRPIDRNPYPDETPAEQVLRKLACWLGVGGYNAETVDAEAFHRKIVDGIEMALAVRASAPAVAAPTAQPSAAPLPAWSECERIRDLPAVDEAITALLEDATGDNAACVVRAVLEGVAPAAKGEAL